MLSVVIGVAHRVPCGVVKTPDELNTVRAKEAFQNNYTRKAGTNKHASCTIQPCARRPSIMTSSDTRLNETNTLPSLPIYPSRRTEAFQPTPSFRRHSNTRGPQTTHAGSQTPPQKKHQQVPPDPRPFDIPTNRQLSGAYHVFRLLGGGREHPVAGRSAGIPLASLLPELVRLKKTESGKRHVGATKPSGHNEGRGGASDSAGNAGRGVPTRGNPGVAGTHGTPTPRTAASTAMAGEQWQMEGKKKNLPMRRRLITTCAEARQRQEIQPAFRHCCPNVTSQPPSGS